VSTGALLRTLSHNGEVNAAIFSPDGKRVLTASTDGTARIWDAATGEELKTLSGHKDAVTSAVFRPDGRFVVTASRDESLRVWDAEDGTIVQVIGDHERPVRTLEFSPDGERLLSASADSVRVWDALGAQPLRRLVGHKESVNAVSFSPDDKLVLTASNDNTARIWDAATGEALQVLKGHEKPVDRAVFSPDGKLVLTASRDDTVRIWNKATGEGFKLLHKAAVSSALFSPDGKLVLTTADDDKTAVVWDTDTDAALVLDGHEGPVKTAVFSPDGKLVLTASNDRTARLWDSRTGAQLLVLRGHADTVNTASFSPDGKFVVTASNDNKAFIWNPNTGEILHSLAGRKVAFSPDGRLVLTVSDNLVFGRGGRVDARATKDSTVRLWDTATGNPTKTLKSHGKFVTARFSPDGKLVLTIPDSSPAYVWDTSTGALLQELRVRGWVADSVFSPNGKLIVGTLVYFGEAPALWSATPPLPTLLQYWRASTGRPMTPQERADSGLTQTRQSEKTEGSWQQCSALTAHPFDPEGMGAGVPYNLLDHKTAIEVCEKALAEHPGNPQILYQLGRAKAHAADAASDKADKKKLMTEAEDNYRAAEASADKDGKHYPIALFAIAILKDTAAEEAVRLLELAYKGNVVLAPYRLSQHYANGNGVAKDMTEARRWLELGANEGDPNANAELGRMCWVGNDEYGIKKDWEEALYRFTLSVKLSEDRGFSDNKWGMLNRANLARRFPIEKVTAIWERAQAWRPKASSAGMRLTSEHK
jgi:WD40 repeat protein/TPR repeat protein